MIALVPLARPAEVLLWAAPLPGESEFVLEDPLALDYLGQQVGYFLLPALTTRSGQAQYFAVVLYGLDLAERALKEYGLPDDDDERRRLFERWERLWALATLESRNGSLGRGHPDAMRGARGVSKAWFSGEKPLPRDYPLISRQSELSGLGAYLVPLRDLGLVYPDSLRITPAATPIVDAFWGEPGTMHMQRFDNWALHVLAPATARIERKFPNFRLATLGERSRLTSILGRKPQQDPIFEAVVERAPPPTLAVARLVEQGPQECNPLSHYPCPAGEGCYLNYGGNPDPVIEVSCSDLPKGAGVGSSYGSGPGVNCERGLACVAKEFDPACETLPEDEGCCQPLCDLGAPDACEAGRTCVPYQDLLSRLELLPSSDSSGSASRRGPGLA
ncbi:hypothetical protein SAMN02745121_08882 [Nannocystis exedens]|uniref:Uncharacterized protein n=1 Tax=Nannocystis exedens TaxID=54 RepID=A0A1I2IPV1_9BACT|nr:hypothetical protein [Nannocystis exedens]PCC69106.1 hypothetical protein NAEX_02128 [Nannocystis exedens]SFF44294.1 hypothetical protein SAMN02745121_08882 [Nannocystis exedens]